MNKIIYINFYFKSTLSALLLSFGNERIQTHRQTNRRRRGRRLDNRLKYQTAIPSSHASLAPDSTRSHRRPFPILLAGRSHSLSRVPPAPLLRLLPPFQVTKTPPLRFYWRQIVFEWKRIFCEELGGVKVCCFPHYRFAAGYMILIE